MCGPVGAFKGFFGLWGLEPVLGAEKKDLTFRVTFFIVGYMNTYTSYWINDNGAIVCHDHAGNYLQSGIKARPKAKSHRTPLGRWELLTDEEVNEWGNGLRHLCETCQFNSK